MMKVAIMQPYFFPYAGYFRLFSECEKFVFLDCVQFPRRGWVHRNRLTNDAGELAWLTLPMIKGDRNTTMIEDLKFPTDAKESLIKQFSRFPALRNLEEKKPEVFEMISDLREDVTEYLIRTILYVAEFIGIDRPYIRSSSLGIAKDLKAQDRIMAIAKAVGATEYVNLPGGAGLYDSSVFVKNGLDLSFLPDYKGSYVSILERIIQESDLELKKEIELNC